MPLVYTILNMLRTLQPVRPLHKLPKLEETGFKRTPGSRIDCGLPLHLSSRQHQGVKMLESRLWHGLLSLTSERNQLLVTFLWDRC